MTALVIPAAGHLGRIEWPLSDKDQLTAMYRSIGCSTVTIVSTGDDEITVWADDEDLFVAEPEFNPRASLLCGGPIVGTILVTGPAGPNGETLPLPEGLIGFQRDETG